VSQVTLPIRRAAKAGRKARVSVVVPIWNTAACLPACLQSLAEQTLADIEIIAVNDASPDDALSVLRARQEHDPRLRVINLERNRGVSAARNIGLSHARGEYVAFVDSDDRPLPDFCEKLYQAASLAGADIAKGAFTYQDKPEVNLELNQKIRADKNAFFFQFCSALYRRSFLLDQGILFPEDLGLSEDLVFALSAATRANRVKVVDEARIVINTRSGSASCAAPIRAHLAQHCQALGKIVAIVRESDMGEDSFNFVTARVFALFLRIAARSADPATGKFAVGEIRQLFPKVRSSGRFDETLFLRYLDPDSDLLYGCLTQDAPEAFAALGRTIRREQCATLRRRIL
jgi:hypothetical protein